MIRAPAGLCRVQAAPYGNRLGHDRESDIGFVMVARAQSSRAGPCWTSTCSPVGFAGGDHCSFKCRTLVRDGITVGVCGDGVGHR